MISKKQISNGSRFGDSIKRRFPRFLLFLVIILHLFSLYFPVSYENDGVVLRHSSGARVIVDLLREPMFPFLAWPAVLPNVVLWLGIILELNDNWTGARICASIALLGAIAVPILSRILAEEDPGYRLAAGYYLWVLSMALLTVSSFLKLK